MIFDRKPVFFSTVRKNKNEEHNTTTFKGAGSQAITWHNQETLPNSQRHTEPQANVAKRWFEIFQILRRTFWFRLVTPLGVKRKVGSSKNLDTNLVSIGKPEIPRL